MENLQKYNKKRDFNKTNEPKGIIHKSNKKLSFVVQHHQARKNHYDLRLELDGVMLSWAVPKGPSYNTKDKRLAVHVENHPISYNNFEGTIPKGEYGAGTVMLWDKGILNYTENPHTTYKKGYLKFNLNGKKLKGGWTLIKFKEDNWLLIKENDGIKGFKDINKYNKSIKTGRTMSQIKSNKETIDITITNPDKIIFKDSKITKLDIIKYYEKVSKRMLPFLKDRLISTVRCPDGIDKEIFFKKHFESNKYLKKFKVKKDKKVKDYYYINDLNALISEAQMNSVEFHIWGSTIKDINHPDIMVFDLDPDEKLSLNKVREGVKDLKKVLDDLNLKSYLKTSGGKGYHIVVPLSVKITWSKCKKSAHDITQIMIQKYPNKYTNTIKKSARKNKIFIDFFRNMKGSTSVCPYSIRARKKAPVSMPIKWSELDKITPNEITITEALKRLKRKDPWEGFFS